MYLSIAKAEWSDEPAQTHSHAQDFVVRNTENMEVRNKPLSSRLAKYRLYKARFPLSKGTAHYLGGGGGGGGDWNFDPIPKFWMTPPPPNKI